MGRVAADGPFGLLGRGHHRLDLALGAQLPPDELKMLVRSMFVGPFTVVDYSAIEARGGLEPPS